MLDQIASMWLRLFLSLVIFLATGSNSAAGQPQGNLNQKITFDLSQLNGEGLYGSHDGLRALDYEFCIPAKPDYAAQVQQIDPTVSISRGSRGRIGCSKDEYLCLGNTHQPNFKAVLGKLASLPYVKRIDQAFFE